MDQYSWHRPCSIGVTFCLSASPGVCQLLKFLCPCSQGHLWLVGDTDIKHFLAFHFPAICALPPGSCCLLRLTWLFSMNPQKVEKSFLYVADTVRLHSDLFGFISLSFPWLLLLLWPVPVTFFKGHLWVTEVALPQISDRWKHLWVYPPGAVLSKQLTCVEA